MVEWLIFMLVGVISGLLSGLLGLGGGLIAVPSLLFIFSWQGMAEAELMRVAIATSLMMIVCTSLVSTYTHHRFFNVNWLIVKRMAAGLAIGGFLGAYLVSILASQLLKVIFAGYMLFVAVSIWQRQLPCYTNQRLLTNWPLVMIAHLIGAISALVGIGGGSLTVPYLLATNQSMSRAIGTSAACGFPIAVAAAVNFLLFGKTDNAVSPWQIGFIHWQACLAMVSGSIIFVIIGAKLVNHLPVVVLKRLFSLALLLGSGYFFYQGLG